MYIDLAQAAEICFAVLLVVVSRVDVRVAHPEYLGDLEEDVCHVVDRVFAFRRDASESDRLVG